ncbi:hypothetical protein [Brachybacterium huguangmaarense]
MHIDFGALGLVAVVTLVACVAIVTVVSLGARFLQPADGAAAATVPAGRRAAGWAMFAIAGAAVLFGLYLVIPYFH